MSGVWFEVLVYRKNSGGLHEEYMKLLPDIPVDLSSGHISDELTYLVSGLQSMYPEPDYRIDVYERWDAYDIVPLSKVIPQVQAPDEQLDWVNMSDDEYNKHIGVDV